MIGYVPSERQDLRIFFNVHCLILYAAYFRRYNLFLRMQRIKY